MVLSAAWLQQTPKAYCGQGGPMLPIVFFLWRFFLQRPSALREPRSRITTSVKATLFAIFRGRLIGRVCCRCETQIIMASRPAFWSRPARKCRLRASVPIVSSRQGKRHLQLVEPRQAFSSESPWPALFRGRTGLRKQVLGTGWVIREIGVG